MKNMLTDCERVFASGASLLLAGATITSSLAFNRLMNAAFECYNPEPPPSDKGGTLLHRFKFCVFTCVFVVLFYFIITRLSRATYTLPGGTVNE